MGLKEKVEKALEKVRPLLMRDGGNVELVEVDEETKTVKVRLTGHCAGCPFAAMTLQQGITRAIKEAVPEIEKVESV